jgi:hypothetical protein
VLGTFGKEASLQRAASTAPILQNGIDFDIIANNNLNIFLLCH